jgi:hypothetical protein
MNLVRYGTNVFDIDDVYGLDLYQKGEGDWRLKVVIHGGTQSFQIRFDDGAEAEEAFEAICAQLDVEELETESSAEDDDDTDGLI